MTGRSKDLDTELPAPWILPAGPTARRHHNIASQSRKNIQINSKTRSNDGQGPGKGEGLGGRSKGISCRTAVAAVAIAPTAPEQFDLWIVGNLWCMVAAARVERGRGKGGGSGGSDGRPAAKAQGDEDHGARIIERLPGTGWRCAGDGGGVNCWRWSGSPPPPPPPKEETERC